MTNAHVFNLNLPSGVSDPARVFTLWDFGDGSPLSSTVGVFTSHVYSGSASYSWTATTFDPTTGTSCAASGQSSTSSSSHRISPSSLEVFAQYVKDVRL